MYQLFVGEIGITRHEFLYELTWWEINSIIRGYRRRDRLKLQIMAECAYAALFAMRDPNGKTAADLFPQLFNDDEEEPEPISEEEQNDLLDVIRAVNNKPSS